MNVKEKSEKVGLKLNLQKMIMTSGPITSWEIDGETVETVIDFIFLGSKITADGDCSHEIKTLAPWKESYDKSRQCIKKQRHHIANKCLYKAMVFPVVVYGCESWTIKKAEHFKNWCFQTVMLEKTLESPWDSKEIKPVNHKGNQPWIFIGRTDTETPILSPSDVKSWFMGKEPDAGKDWRQEEKGTIKDEMVEWYHRFDEHEFEQVLGDGKG